ncbi:hypothetical protein A9Q93_12790 [Nonlabens dokdonensis]|uniref:Uncharacterized protein n=1 Tax=Nonlabens dokdonensis TaxID=328515 RepID=A0A1Z8AJJ5_9FLAO|nr:hypothetical protein A9Q93_12790 [Nonlabens dokdonensis]
MGIVGNIAVIFCICISVLGISFYIKTKNPSQNTFYLFSIPSIILAVFALCTSWIWLYYFCLYISMPALLLSILSGFMAYKIDSKNKAIKVIIGLQMAAIVFALLGALFFNII